MVSLNLKEQTIQGLKNYISSLIDYSKKNLNKRIFCKALNK